jgi:hypothetical protein
MGRRVLAERRALAGPGRRSPTGDERLVIPEMIRIGIQHRFGKVSRAKTVKHTGDVLGEGQSPRSKNASLGSESAPSLA